MSFQEEVDSYMDEMRLKGHGKAAIAGIAAIAIACLLIACFINSQGICATALQIDDAPEEATEQEENPNDGTDDAGKLIYVHVAGAVAKSGMVELPEGSRVADAVEAAGGMSEDAIPESVNLARLLQDGEQLRVASASEQLATAPDESIAEGEGSKGAIANGVVNLNLASKEDLMTLSGIGESKAQKILDYREDVGSFKSIDDLLNVSGIGEKTLDALRASICI